MALQAGQAPTFCRRRTRQRHCFKTRNRSPKALLWHVRARTVIVIPARYASSRFPGKPLVEVCGKKAILWTLGAAQEIPGIDEVYVATDDERIEAVIQAAGGKVLMIAVRINAGTARNASPAPVYNLDSKMMTSSSICREIHSLLPHGSSRAWSPVCSRTVVLR